MYAEEVISRMEYELNLENGQAETLAWREDRLVKVIRKLRTENDNAKITIAAAPELLEVLEELLENGTCYLSAIELDHNYDGEEWEKKARTAIAKAKGR